MREIWYKNRVIGQLYEEDKIFRKVVQSSKHLFKKMDAWGLDADLLENTLVPGEHEIRILDKDEMKVYTITAKEFKRDGVYLHFKKGADHGTQVFVPRAKFAMRLLEKS